MSAGVRRKLTCLAVVLFLLPAVMGGCIIDSSGGGRGRYYGIFIGVSTYAVSQFNLNYADADAMSMVQTFIAGPNWDRANMTVLINSAATKAAIRDAIYATAARMAPEDILLFYFSGHGSRIPDVAPIDESDGLDETLIPYDALRNSYANDITDDEFEVWMNAVPSANVCIILDASFSGGIFKGTDAVKSVRREEVESFPRGRTGLDSFLRDVGRTGFVVMTASDVHESPIESSLLGHGVFTYYLVEGLDGPADVNGNLNVSAEEAYNYAAPRSTAFYQGMHPQLLDLHSGAFPLLELP